LSSRQQLGQELEQRTYDTLKDLLKSRLGTAGRESNIPNGLLWRASNYSLFYNKQVIKKGQYPKGVKYKRKRIADLVLCDNNRKASLPGFYKNAILAIELKNTNLDYKLSKAWIFDRDILSRFLWTQDAFDTLNANGRGWEAQAGIGNLFPNAIRVLIIPRFAHLASASKTPVLKLDALTKRILAKCVKAGLIPASSSERDQIEWRIKRLELHVHELNWQFRPDEWWPNWVTTKLKRILDGYLNQLGV
jgi:hypothetical protein